MIVDKGNHSMPPPPQGSFLLGTYLHQHFICDRLLEHFPVASETLSKARLLEPGFFFKQKTGLWINLRQGSPGGVGGWERRERVTWQVRLHAWQAPFEVTLCSCRWPSGRKSGCVCESRHDFSKDQHLYTLESPFIHSAADINQRSGPDSPALKPAREWPGRVRSVYLKGLSTLHSLIVFRPKGTIAQIEAPLRLLRGTHQNGYSSPYKYGG